MLFQLAYGVGDDQRWLEEQPVVWLMGRMRRLVRQKEIERQDAASQVEALTSAIGGGKRRKPGGLRWG